MSDWRNKLNEEESHIVDDAQVTVSEWHGEAIDCWRWKKVVAKMAELLDEYWEMLNAKD